MIEIFKVKNKEYTVWIDSVFICQCVSRKMAKLIAERLTTNQPDGIKYPNEFLWLRRIHDVFMLDTNKGEK